MKSLIALSIFFLLVACGDNRTTEESTSAVELVAGSVMAMKVKDEYVIAKILVVEDTSVYVRFYNETVEELPADISTDGLTYQTGYAPLSRSDFEKRNLTVITSEAVSESEQQDYKNYLDSLKAK